VDSAAVRAKLRPMRWLWTLVLMLGCAGAPTPTWQRVPAPPAMPTPTQSGRVEANGAAIYFASYGKGDPVILLHGGLGHGDVWGFQMPALVGFRVITIDTRGHGRSSKPDAPLTYAAMAADVIAVMDALGIQKAAIVGWSDGAIVGLQLAMTHAERITRVFSFGANVTRAGQITKPNPTVGKYVEMMAADYDRIAEAKRFEQTSAMIGDLYKREPEFTPEQLGKIAIPVLIVDGDKEEVVRRDHTQAMSRWIPGALVVMLPNVGHLAPWQDPTHFNRELRSFLKL
jgi:pimeloyl-ACP methyl ester carboxylesterase